MTFLEQNKPPFDIQNPHQLQTAKNLQIRVGKYKLGCAHITTAISKYVGKKLANSFDNVFCVLAILHLLIWSLQV